MAWMVGTARLRFTPEQFHQLGAMGLLDPERRYELIEGDIYEMTPVGPEHGYTVDIATQTLAPRSKPGEYYVRIQNPLRLGESEPVPDISVVPGKPEDYAHALPTTALLIIEIADTSLERDRTTKLALYARCQIPEYWIVNLSERVVEVYREPQGEEYRSLRRYTLEETITPLFDPEWRVQAGSLFPQTP
ncbi:MAG: Uma2 family endonuclease [Fimbriimonadales bacterium]|nr:Uma2 family endonuclease [Fimbriimonadales bacterium]